MEYQTIYHIGQISGSNKYRIIALHNDEYYTAYSNDAFKELDEAKAFAKQKNLTLHNDTVIRWMLMSPSNKLMPDSRGKKFLIFKAVKLTNKWFKMALDTTPISDLVVALGLDSGGMDDIELGSYYFYSFASKDTLKHFTDRLDTLIKGLNYGNKMTIQVIKIDTPVSFFSDDYKKYMIGKVKKSSVITDASGTEISYEIETEERIKSSNLHYIDSKEIKIIQ